MQRRGLHGILEISAVYNIVQRLFQHEPTQTVWNSFISQKKLGSVLDVGCGPGNQSKNFSKSEGYIGIDISEFYIAKARERFGNFGNFEVLSALDVDKLPDKNFDLVILSGVLHHMTNDEVTLFFAKVREKLSPDGLVVTVDPVYCRGRYFANFLVSLDRGMHVRTNAQLTDLAQKYFTILKTSIIEQKIPPYQRILFKLSKH
ncbi:class I SAM-dependent methyltransferase [Alphaproteobacteria bacterium]|nr:class I SAM-dependent methyltransferase [Alphaproteobacteria bacterium]